MKKNILEQRAAINSRNGYVVPYVETYRIAPFHLLAESHFDSDHLQGNIEGADESGHVQGDLDPGGGGVNILGTKFSFTDPWE